MRVKERKGVMLNLWKPMKGEEMFVYYESIKRELNKRLIFECRCDARLKVEGEGCTRLPYTM
jgi:hypothetical protein